MRLLSGIALAAVAFAATAAHAGTFFGYTAAPNATASGAALDAHDSFLAALSQSGTEDFEGFAANQTAPLALTFDGSPFTGTLTGSGDVRSDFNGLFPTSGALQFYSTSDAVITFATPVTAFGFYATDVSDYGRALTVMASGVGGTQTFHVTNGSHLPNGSLLFFGFTSSTAISSVRLAGAAASDGFGYDDLVTGVTAVPEAASWSMMIAGFGLVGGALRSSRVRRRIQPA